MVSNPVLVSDPNFLTFTNAEALRKMGEEWIVNRDGLIGKFGLTE